MKLLAVVARGLRADMLGPYGNRWIDTPNLDILAAGGAVFDRHFAASPGPLAPWVPPDVPTCLVRDSGRGGVALGGPWAEAHACAGLEATIKRARSRLKALRPADDWLLWVEIASLLPPWQIAPRFLDKVFDPPPPEEEPDEDADEDEEESRGLELLPEEERLEPLLDPPGGVVDADDDTLFLRAQSTFAAAVMQLDAVLGELLDGLPDDVTLIVTSDEGVSLGEHGWMGRGDSRLFDARTHVPLIILGPGWPAGLRVAGLTASSDLGPTVAAMFDSPHAGEGASILPLASPGAAWPRPHLVLRGEGESALRSEAWLLRKPEGGGAALYEKPADRHDLADVAAPRFAAVEELEPLITADGALAPSPPGFAGEEGRGESS